MSISTRERLVTAMAELLRTRGYSGTSVKQVTAAAKAPMGSLYHHFPEGKPQLAEAALRTSGAAYGQLIPLLMDPYDDLREAVPAAFTAAAEQIEQTGWINMCPVGTVAGEIADAEPALREVTAEVIGAWITDGTEYFTRRGVPPAAAHDLILAILSALEGAFVLCRTLRSAEPLRSAGRAMSARVEEILSSSVRA
ncbi:TetR/AcrR family transcriptional regulator [Nocardia puris]|uniref:TetR family transcriptional regulator n=2 Tax=Nocardia puris TaxID=208602 RepID=A0A366CYW5_9NOCA|nr:TetR/AcrR family transcriptional regulator [Nocardia puris]MBF6365637.1 TetR/AcrR family transcriptional regulator [Nocardia puris]MBF6460720.1 TetR/AcrR family transcriptional regulator [Nocardia puris]RBO83040.1 TetR family transcriptional regulator [Nocardia puris]